jgi:adenine-specific DNA-methyltransferase
MPRSGSSRGSKKAETYRHEEEALLRPDVGTQAQFRKKKPPKTYRYDASLSPSLDTPLLR